MQARNLADLYGLAPLDWAKVAARLAEGIAQAPGTGGPDRHTCWLTTINEDGSPHVTGIGAVYVDDAFWFETGERTRKGRNLARDPRCVLRLATSTFDLVVEGEAVKVTDPATVDALAQRWVAQGWPCQVDESVPRSRPSTALPRPDRRGPSIASGPGRRPPWRPSSPEVLPAGGSDRLPRLSSWHTHLVLHMPDGD